MLGEFAEAQAVEWSADEQDKEQNKERIYEILADAFATYMMGPAYVCAAVSLRLEPLVAFDEDTVIDNPTDIERGETMFAVLKRMNDTIRRRAAKRPGDGETGEPSNPYGYGMNDLKRQWDEALRRATTSEGPSMSSYPDRARLEGLVNTAFGELEQVLTRKGQYSRPGPASGLAEAETWARDWLAQLERSREGEQEELPVREVTPGSTLRDVLNAAWLCRVQNKKPDKVGLIADAAYRFCKAVLETRDEPATATKGRQRTAAGQVSGQRSMVR
jgi:hypothetical protein